MICDKDCFNCKYEDCIAEVKITVQTEEQKERMKEYNARNKKKRYYKAKAEGMCVHCLKKPATHGVLCYECWLKDNRRTKERYHRNKNLLGRAEWKAQGLCYFCGSEPMTGQKLCEKHYKMSVESLKKAREKQRTNEKT